MSGSDRFGDRLSSKKNPHACLIQQTNQCKKFCIRGTSHRLRMSPTDFTCHRQISHMSQTDFTHVTDRLHMTQTDSLLHTDDAPTESVSGNLASIIQSGHWSFCGSFLQLAETSFFILSPFPLHVLLCQFSERSAGACRVGPSPEEWGGEAFPKLGR